MEKFMNKIISSILIFSGIVLAQSNYWTKLNGPNITFIDFLLSSSDHYLYAVTRELQPVWVSSDLGVTWQQSSYSIPSLERHTIIKCITGKNGIFYMVLRNHDSERYIIVKSIDHGQTFSVIQKSINGYLTLFIDMQDNLYSDHDDKSYFSSDNGETWNLLGNFDGIVKKYITDDNYLYGWDRVDDGDILYYSKASPNLDWLNLIKIGYMFPGLKSFISNSLGHLFLDFHDDEGGLFYNVSYRSTDGGYIWQEIPKVYDYDTYGNYTNALPNGLLYRYNMGTKFVSESVDNGDTWIDISSGLSGAIWCQGVWQDGYFFLATQDQGVFRTEQRLCNYFIPKNILSVFERINNVYGVNWIDCNNDGFEDLFFSKQGPNGLYCNNGDGTFTRITTGAIVTDDEPSRAATWGDYDNDGDADLFVANEGANNSLYRNNGNGSFSKTTTGALVTTVNASRGCAWGDYDNDGLLDLVVVNRNERSALYRNLGDGTFQAVANPFGSDIGDSFGCSWCDYDLDGDLDLFVANRGENYLYRQISKGAFQRVGAGAFPPEDLYSFGGSWGDYDNDGYPDLFVTNADGNNSLYHNNGNGTFARTSLAGITTDGGKSKGSGWADYDKDGDLDLFVANNGSKFFYRNNGDGTFTAVSSDEFVYYPSNTLSLAWGDCDNDGDQDLLVTSYDQQTVLYQNIHPTNHWLKVKCIGTLSNKSGIGARVAIKANINGQMKWQTREITSQSGFAGQSSLAAHFGLGTAEMIDSLRIVWPSGQVQVMTGVMVDEYLTIIEPAVVPVELASFTASSEEGKIVLHWRTLSQQNNYGFEIERKCDPAGWKQIGFIAGHGTTSEANDYEYQDDTLVMDGKYSYRLKIIDTAGQFQYSEIAEISFGLPVAFELLQNYPNPFNPTTNIQFSLPTSENVTIRVYSILGEQVEELINGYRAAGKYDVAWDAAHHPSGIYIIIFEAGGFHQARKAVLMK